VQGKLILNGKPSEEEEYTKYNVCTEYVHRTLTIHVHWLVYAKPTLSSTMVRIS